MSIKKLIKDMLKTEKKIRDEINFRNFLERKYPPLDLQFFAESEPPEEEEEEEDEPPEPEPKKEPSQKKKGKDDTPAWAKEIINLLKGDNNPTPPKGQTVPVPEPPKAQPNPEEPPKKQSLLGWLW